ncbi:serine/threonine-protein kinase 16 isoform X2 [Lycorma delicatula]|uniref:serine/threonine-protein kinase 16 isoform X2 n=1 Tax=Lycorma delicatula TaxID=130591 RepID=UPI003F51354D
MNALGLSLILKMGCLCTKDVITVNSKKYYVLEQLGEGGFSVVLLVENVRTKKRFAVKKIICHSIDDQKLAIDEVNYHKVLDHPNILQCLDSTVQGVADPVLNSTSEVLLLLPYYPKGTLARELEIRFKNKQYLEVNDILRIFLQVCEGLKALHEAKPVPLAHRDLKTANILLDVDYSPVIMDLGSVAPASMKICGSSEAQKLQDTASERCSMPYRAPELFNVESYCMIDQRVDIWELHDLIRYMLKVNPMERPYIYSVIEKGHDTLSKIKITA